MRDRVARGDLGRVLSVTGSYTQDWLLSPDDYNWRVEPDGGTNLRAVADIGTHWMDLAQFVVGRPIRAADRRPRHLPPDRHRPVGPAETFGGPGDAGDDPARRRHDRRPRRRPLPDGRRRPGRLPRLAGHGGPQEPARPGGRRHALARWPGTARTPTTSGSAAATAPTSGSPATPPCSPTSASALSHYPGGHAEGFPDTFKQLALCVYGWIGAPTGARPPARRPSRPSRTATARSCSARRSPGAPRGAWVTWRTDLTTELARWDADGDASNDRGLPSTVSASAMAEGRLTYRRPAAMKLGFVSAILPEYTLEQVLRVRRRGRVLERRADVLAPRPGRTPVRGRHATST